MLIPLGWSVVGGLDGMKASLEPFRFSLATPSGIGPWVIAMLTVNGLVGIMAQPHQLATVGTGRDERTCRVGMFYGNFVKRVCTVGWALVGLIVAAMVAQGHGDAAMLGDPENAFGFACRQLLFPGALGLLIASILAANMSTCSAFLVDSGALFTEGLYRQRLAPNRPDRHYLWVGRDQRPRHHHARRGLRDVPDRERAVHVPADRNARDVCRHQRARRHRLAAREPMGRAGEPGHRAATNFLLYYLDRPTTGSLGSRTCSSPRSCVGIVALVVVSLLTRPSRRSSIESFFDRLQTSSDDADRLSRSRALTRDRLRILAKPVPCCSSTSCALRDGAAGRGWRAYRDDLGGFAIGWVLVIVLVIATVMFL